MLINYRLAPEHPFPAALEDALVVYESLLEKNIPANNIMLGGDSAGGGIVMSTLLTIKEKGLPMPAGAFMLSPWVDLSCSGKSAILKDDIDPMISLEGAIQWADLYLNGLQPKNPVVSSVFADLSGLPPLFIQVGTNEILYDDAVRLYEKAKSDGVEAELDVYHDLFHVFQLFAPIVPESKSAIEKLGLFIRNKINAKKHSVLM